jgi:hypothetical protein
MAKRRVLFFCFPFFTTLKMRRNRDPIAANIGIPATGIIRFYFLAITAL